MTLEELANKVERCYRCSLSETRTNVVFGRGSESAAIMFIGEGPGADEDKQGLPFVGRSGQLLDRMMTDVEMPLDDIYICNIVKCRPPGNRLPNPVEIEACRPFWREQIKIICPQIIVCLGALATQMLLGADARITKERGHWVQKGDFLIMPTFHPAAILRDENKKKDVYADFREVKNKYWALQGLAADVAAWPPK